MEPIACLRRLVATSGFVMALLSAVHTPAAEQEGLRLAATLVDTQQPAALLEWGQAQAWLRSGESIAGCLVARIEASVVELDCGADVLTLRLDAGATGDASPQIMPSLHSVVLPRGTLQALATRPQAVALAIDLAPVVDAGELLGWQVARLDEHGPLAGIGLIEADLVLAVDGAPARQPAAFAAALRAIPNSGGFTLDLVRDGRPHTLLVTSLPPSSP